MQDDQVGVAVVVEIQQEHCTAVGPRAGQPVCRGQRPETAVEVVVEQFVGAVGVDQEQVEVAVVVGVEHRAVHGILAASGGAGRGGGVVPAAVGALLPERVRSAPAEVDIGMSVVVDIAPQCGIDIPDRRERVVRHDRETAVGTAVQHRVVGVCRGRGTGDEQVGLAVGIDIGNGQVRRGTPGPQRQCGDRRGEQRARGRRGARCRARLPRGGLAQGAHAGVLELDEPGPRVVGELRVAGERLSRSVRSAALAVDLCQGVIGAAQVGVGLHHAPVPGQRRVRVAALLQGLRQEIGRVGIVRVGREHGLQVTGGDFQCAAPELQQARTVACPQVVRLLHEQGVESRAGRRFVPFELPVHQRHGLVEAEQAHARKPPC
ncbi:MAG: hypothetical protein R3F42_05955 [Pseudomonadota bacterium]